MEELRTKSSPCAVKSMQKPGFRKTNFNCCTFLLRFVWIFRHYCFCASYCSCGLQRGSDCPPFPFPLHSCWWPQGWPAAPGESHQPHFGNKQQRDTGMCKSQDLAASFPQAGTRPSAQGTVVVWGQAPGTSLKGSAGMGLCRDASVAFGLYLDGTSQHWASFPG